MCLTISAAEHASGQVYGLPEVRRYQNCDAMRAAGWNRGVRQYGGTYGAAWDDAEVRTYEMNRRRDGDRDGHACEPRPAQGQDDITGTLAVTILAAAVIGVALWMNTRRKDRGVRGNPDTPVRPSRTIIKPQARPRDSREDSEETLLGGRKAQEPSPLEEKAPAVSRSDENAGLVRSRRLGKGGFGTTWLAHDHVTRREVAVKIYRPADWADEGADGSVSLRSEEHRKDFEWGLERFLEEGQLLRTISHQAVVRVHRHGRGYGSAYLVMELITGPSLPARGESLAFRGIDTAALVLYTGGHGDGHDT